MMEMSMKKTNKFFMCIFAIICFTLMTVLVGCVLTNGKIGSKNIFNLFKGSSEKKIKNVIVMIGDGMGPQAIGLLVQYAKFAQDSIYKDHKTAVENAMDSGTLGMVYHNAYNVLVTDSAASATQMASGKDALSETIGIDKDGNPAKSMLEIAEELGKSTGLVSDTRITHATPAAFAAHQPHRTNENEIAVEMLNSGADVLLSGGLRYFIPKEASDSWSQVHTELSERTNGKVKIKSKRKDSRNLLKEAEEKGYAVALTKDEMNAVDNDKLLGLFNYSVLDYRIDYNLNDPERTLPTLKEMTIKAVDTLSKNDKGFFLMVESGLIDWAEHDNDAGTLLHEMIRFDETLKYLYEWVSKRDDTLLLISADHETGGFSFSYSRKDVPFEHPVDFPGTQFPEAKFEPRFNFGETTILSKIFKQKKSYQRMMDEFEKQQKYDLTAPYTAPRKAVQLMKKIINGNTEFPITTADAKSILATEKNNYRVKNHGYLDVPYFPKINDFKEFYVYESEIRKDIIARVVAHQQYAVWSTGTHTNTPVPLIACGPEKSAKKFGKMLHTTQWAQEAINVIKNGQ